MALLRAVHPFVYRYRDARGAEHSVRLMGERVDRGGSEGYTADQQVGGRWERVYRVYADAFPMIEDDEGRRRLVPAEEETVIDGIDDARQIVSDVTLTELPPFPGVYDLTCRRTKTRAAPEGGPAVRRARQ